MNRQKINWSSVWSVLSPFLTMAITWTAAELATCYALSIGKLTEYSLLKLGLIFGLLVGCALSYFGLYRPMRKMHLRQEEELWKLIVESMAVNDSVIKQLKKRRIEGDEWKDG